jgi:hypothetical protein
LIVYFFIITISGGRLKPVSAEETRKIFLCYRRDDSGDATGRLYDRLALEFGDKSIFMDVDSMRLGQDFVDRLTAEVHSCDALLAVIGPNWLDARDEEGNRRLDNPDDFVRIEISAALQRDIPVIPILLNGTKIPRADRLPPELQKLARRSALDVRSGSFHSDTIRLIADLKRSPSTEPPSNQGSLAARPHSPIPTTSELFTNPNSTQQQRREPFTNPKVRESLRDFPSAEPPGNQGTNQKQLEEFARLMSNQGTNPKLEELARLAKGLEQPPSTKPMPEPSPSTEPPSNQGTDPRLEQSPRAAAVSHAPRWLRRSAPFPSGEGPTKSPGNQETDLKLQSDEKTRKKVVAAWILSIFFGGIIIAYVIAGAWPDPRSSPPTSGSLTPGPPTQESLTPSPSPTTESQTPSPPTQESPTPNEAAKGDRSTPTSESRTPVPVITNEWKGSPSSTYFPPEYTGKEPDPRLKHPM